MGAKIKKIKKDIYNTLILDSNLDILDIPSGNNYILDLSDYITKTMSMYRTQKLFLKICNYTGAKPLTTPIQLGLIIDTSIGFVDKTYLPGERIQNIDKYIRNIIIKEQTRELVIEIKTK